MLERHNALQTLDEAFKRACSGGGPLVLVSGEAGIGKSTLVEHFVREKSVAARILRGYCDPLLTPTALGPLHDISRQLGGQLSRLIDEGTRTATIFASVLEVLHAFSRPTILLFEDIHWADEATFDLLKYLGRRLDTAPVLIIVTFRDDEAQRHEALGLALGSLASLRTVERLRLSRLSPAAVAELAADRAGDPEVLYRMTGGNPFFVSEVLESRTEGVPPTVRDAVLARAAALGPDGRAVLDLAAVIGSRIDYALLEHFPQIVEKGLPDCLSFGLLQDGKFGFAFRHELARTAILEAIDPLRRRTLSRKILAAALLVGTRLEGREARLAHYAESAGSADDVVRFATAAGRRASAVGAHIEAAAHFKSVLRFSEGRSSQERAQALVDYGRECTVVDRLTDAINAYREAATLWEECGDRLRHGSTLAALAWPLVRHGSTSDADDTVAEAIALLEPLGASRELADAYRTQAHLRMLDRACDSAVEIGGRAIAMAADLEDVTTLASAEMVVGAAKLVTDDREGKEHLDRSIALAHAHRLHEVIALAYMNLGSAFGEQYHFKDAETELLTGLAFTRENDLDHSAHYMSSWLALTQMFQGRWSEAAEQCSQLLKQPSLSAISRIMTLVALGRIRVRRGDPGGAEALDEALVLASRTSTLQRLAPVHAARAELAWYAGDIRQVAAEAAAILDLAVDRRHAWHTGEFLYWRKLSGQEDIAYTWAARPYALQIAGDWQSAADAWRELGCPFEEARALSEGDEDAQVRALAIFDRLSAGPAGAMLRRNMRTAGIRRIPRGPRESTRKNPSGLTRREMATLGHLVRGATNAAIAKALYISPKTVDHHVSSILEKLHASTRGEAAQIAMRDGLIPKDGEV